MPGDVLETTKSTCSSQSLHNMKLLDLPPEVLIIIICKLSPVSLSRFSQSCRALYDCVNALGDTLWQGVFLTLWDNPAYADGIVMAVRAPEFCTSLSVPASKGKQPRSGSTGDGSTFRWREEVQRRTETEKFLQRLGQSYDGSNDKMSLRRSSSFTVLLSMLATTPPASTTNTQTCNLAWVDKMLLPDSFAHEYFMRHFFHDSEVLQQLTPDRQLTAKLQLHYLSPIARSKIETDKPKLARLNARAYVYNIRNYQPEGWHGPFVMDSAGLMQPNWIHLAGCQWVILANLYQRRLIGQVYPIPPLGAEAAWGGSAKAEATARKVNPSRVTKQGITDWAGVEGIWRRIVCFMDYRDFHEYNYHGQNTSGGLDTTVFKHLMFNEATRVITMVLRITHSVPSESPFEHRPRLHFQGVSVANDTMISAVHGFVCMTPSGYVRWHLVTRYESDDRWVTEAVQIGEPGSAAGFIGTWTGNNHEPDDPAGPTWLWKIADVSEIPKDDALGSLNHNMFGFPEDEDEDDDEYGDEDDEDDEDDEEEYEEEMVGVQSDNDSDDDGEGGTDESDSNEDDFSEMPSLIPISTLYDLD